MKNKIILKEKIQKALILIDGVILILILLLNNKLNITNLVILSIFYYFNLILLLKFGNLKKLIKEA